jgi:hypothetical protein
VGGSLLVPDEDVMDLRVLPERVKERQGGAARIRPDDIDTLADQAFPDDFSTGVPLSKNNLTGEILETA